MRSGNEASLGRIAERPVVFVNILVWNGRKWLKNCLDSVLAAKAPASRVLVIDNGSTDGSAAIVEKDYPQVELIRNSRNLGFAEGNNVGIRYALARNADYVTLLNQDVTVDPAWLSELLSAAEAGNGFDIFVPRQYDYDGREPDPLFLRGTMEMSPEFKSDLEDGKSLKKIYPLPKALGAAVMISAGVFRKVGAFDPFYFVYHEEMDLFQRCAYHGFRIALAPASRINHWHGSLHPAEMTLRSRYFSYRNNLVLRLKNPGASLFSGLFSCFAWTARCVLENAGSPRGILKGVFVVCLQLLVLFYLPLIVYKRFKEKRHPCYL